MDGTEITLAIAEKKILQLTKDLKDVKQKLLECQMNSADLENKFTKAQEKIAQTDKVRADYRRVSEDNKKKKITISKC